MQIKNQEIKFKDEAIYLKNQQTLAISDLHIGKEEQLRKNGLEFPLKERKEILKRIKKLNQEYNPKNIIFNGDFLHDFKTVPYGVDETIEKLYQIIKNKQITVTIGSHDTMIKHTLKDYPEIEITEEKLINKTLYTHGHKKITPTKNTELIIIGHEHPSIEINQQKFSTYLHIKTKNYDILVTPAFSHLARGVKINNMNPKDFMSPILQQINKKQIHPIIIGDKTRKFPNLQKLQNHF